MKKLFPTIFQTFTFPIEEDMFLQNSLIKITLKKFWKEVMQPLKKDQIVIILFKINFIDENNSPYMRTLGSLIKTNKSEFTRIYNLLSARLEISDEDYISTPIKELIITYKIIDKDNIKVNKTTYPKIEKLITHKIKNYSLPATMNLKLWGLQLSKIENIVRLAKRRSKLTYVIELIN